ncbi:MAG: hypothetical protein HS116_06260 [Planctomycetes bacterium]|nr:hypothetical protein [Planctomycetota bacterium]
MRFEFEPAFVEEAVFIAMRSASTTASDSAAYNRERESVYALQDAEARDRAFTSLHTRWFARQGLEKPLKALLAERRGLETRLNRFLVCLAYRSQEEGVELFGAASEPTPVFRAALRLKVETLLNTSVLERLVRHELMHLADMLNPVFRFDPHPRFPGATAAQQGLVHDRFSSLWDLRIDAALFHEGVEGEMPREGHARRLWRAWNGGAWVSELVDRSFDGQVLDPYDCPAILQFAADGNRLVDCLGLRTCELPVATTAMPCPVCGFPSRSWSTHPERLPEEIQAEIRAKHPDWSAAQGLCIQCEEMMQAALR